MSNTPETQEKNIERREGPSSQSLVASSGHAMIELDPEELRAVVGGAKPKIKVTVKPDGTIVIEVN